jgi:hypothetical protein
VLVVLALIFLCGAAIGAAVTRTYLHSKMFPAPEQHAIEQARRFGLQGLKTELHLTPEQERAITKILDDYGKYYQNIEDQRDDVAEMGRQRILEVLNDQQKKRFTEIFGQPR